MTPLEMIQEFQVHYDKVDSDSQPKIYPEEILLFLNDAQITLVREARAAFEEGTQLTEDLKSLVLDGVIEGQANTGQGHTLFPLNLIKQVGFESEEDPTIPHLYTVRTYGQGSVNGRGGRVSLREVTHNEWEAALLNPHTSPRPSLCPYRYTSQGIIVGTPPALTLSRLFLTFIQYPTPIALATTQGGTTVPPQPCPLPEQVHRLVVFKAVELAQASIQRGTQLNQGQA